jgi:hypothetical protein
VSDKSWNADADLGKGDVNFDQEKPTDYRDIAYEAPAPVTPTAEPPTYTPPTFESAPTPTTKEPTYSSPTPIVIKAPRVGMGCGWLVALIIIGSVLLPMIGAGVAVWDAVDEVGDSFDPVDTTFEDTADARRDSSFRFSVTAAVTSVRSSLPECFFAEASSPTCTAAFVGLGDFIRNQNPSASCSAYQATYADAFEQAAEGGFGSLQAIVERDAANYPFGFAEARSRCEASS